MSRSAKSNGKVDFLLLKVLGVNIGSTGIEVPPRLYGISGVTCSGGICGATCDIYSEGPSQQWTSSIMRLILSNIFFVVMELKFA